jgi:hypothetical protein
LAVEDCQEAHVSFASRSALTVIAVAAAAVVGCVHKSVRDPDARNSTALQNQWEAGRWSNGIETVSRCKAQGRAWEPSEDREEIVCLDPSTKPTDPSVANQSLPAAALPENVF